MNKEKNTIIIRARIATCGYCQHQAAWDRRDRLSFGYYCSNHSDKTTHPGNFYGYLAIEHVNIIEIAQTQIQTAEIPKWAQ